MNAIKNIIIGAVVIAAIIVCIKAILFLGTIAIMLGIFWIIGRCVSPAIKPQTEKNKS